MSSISSTFNDQSFNLPVIQVFWIMFWLISIDDDRQTHQRNKNQKHIDHIKQQATGKPLHKAFAL